MEYTMTTPIIPWIGGKRRLVDLLLSRFPLIVATSRCSQVALPCSSPGILPTSRC